MLNYANTYTKINGIYKALARTMNSTLIPFLLVVIRSIHSVRAVTLCNKSFYNDSDEHIPSALFFCCAFDNLFNVFFCTFFNSTKQSGDSTETEHWQFAVRHMKLWIFQAVSWLPQFVHSCVAIQHTHTHAYIMARSDGRRARNVVYI